VIRAVIFDLGHTLWDIAPGDEQTLDTAYAAMREMLCERLARGDLPGAEAIRRAVADALREDREAYFENGAELRQPPTHTWVDRGCRAVGLTVDEELLRELTPPLFATETDRLICADGTADALTGLRDRGYALGCVTNTLADAPSIRAMLARHNLLDLMASIVVSSEEGWRKPHASLFEKALREVGAEPGEAVFVGDSPYHDICGAKAVGMRAILTRQYVSRPQGSFSPPPDAIIHHLSDLPAALASL
jgi:HAD superfamily hydrolase (TIGR01662 family)